MKTFDNAITNRRIPHERYYVFSHACDLLCMCVLELSFKKSSNCRSTSPKKLSCSTKLNLLNHLLFVPCMVLYKIHRFLLLSLPLYMLRFVLLWFFCLFVLLLIAMSCHCSVCVRLSHLIKDYLLTYLCDRGMFHIFPKVYMSHIF